MAARKKRTESGPYWTRAKEQLKGPIEHCKRCGLIKGRLLEKWAYMYNDHPFWFANWTNWREQVTTFRFSWYGLNQEDDQTMMSRILPLDLALDLIDLREAKKTQVAESYTIDWQNPVPEHWDRWIWIRFSSKEKLLASFKLDPADSRRIVCLFNNTSYRVCEGVTKTFAD